MQNRILNWKRGDSEMNRNESSEIHTDEFDGRVRALADADACEAGTTESIADASAALADVGRAAYENGFDWSTGDTVSRMNRRMWNILIRLEVTRTNAMNNHTVPCANGSGLIAVLFVGKLGDAETGAVSR